MAQPLHHDDSRSDRLVPEKDARKVFGHKSAMSTWRWREAGIICQPIQIRGRNYWRESYLQKWLNSQSATPQPE
jgi:hypothetical protein